MHVPYCPYAPYCCTHLHAGEGGLCSLLSTWRSRRVVDVDLQLDARERAVCSGPAACQRYWHALRPRHNCYQSGSASYYCRSAGPATTPSESLLPGQPLKQPLLCVESQALAERARGIDVPREVCERPRLLTPTETLQTLVVCPQLLEKMRAAIAS